MLPRFYVPDLDPGVALTALPREEASHLTRVLRLTAGDEVAVFDGRGHEFRARVVAAARDRVQVEIVEAATPAPEPRVPITLAQAILKGEGMDAVVRDATMMGVAAIEPLVTARTIGRQRRAERATAVGRWHRLAVSSAKQCRRATVPAIREARTWTEWLAGAGTGPGGVTPGGPEAASPLGMPARVQVGTEVPTPAGVQVGTEVPTPARVQVGTGARTSAVTRLILVEPTASGGSEQSMRILEEHVPAALSLIVGPEGGWTPEEREEAEAAGCLPVTLGALTLRADAVAVVAIALARFALDDQGDTHL